MSEYHNPFDKTIWEPDGESAIEDPFHGPSAIFNMLQIPPMPLGNGVYYQSGMSYLEGTPYIDAKGRPVFYIHATPSMSVMREINRHMEWIKACSEGESAVLALEGGRQQQRIKEKRSAHCYREDDICPGSKRLTDCDTGVEVYRQGEQWAEKAERNEQNSPGEGKVLNTLAFATRKCGQCALACEVGVITDDGKVDGVRVSFYKPPTLDPNTISITIDSQSLRNSPSGGDAVEAHAAFTEALKKLRPKSEE